MAVVIGMDLTIGYGKKNIFACTKPRTGRPACEYYATSFTGVPGENLQKELAQKHLMVKNDGLGKFFWGKKSE